MAGYSLRTVIVPFSPDLQLRRALLDSRSAVNSLVADWRLHPEESRFDSTKRSYRELRTRYPHLASGWVVSMANETSAVLRAWDRTLRRARRLDPLRFERMRQRLPRRRRLKVSLHHDLFRVRGDTLSITVRPGLYSEVDLAKITHPLFHKYRALSEDHFGLTVTDSALFFQFRVPHPISEPSEAAGVDLNFPSAVVATSDGRLGAIDLSPVVRVQRAMERKRASVQRHINKDLRHQRAVLRRYGRREHRRVAPLLHGAVNQLLDQVGERSLVLEDLTDATEAILRREWRAPAARRALTRWPHAEFQRILGYKAHTPVIRVNPRGTSRECPRCEGPFAPPSGNGSPRPREEARRQTCEHCGESYHRDAAAAIVVLSRGCPFLRGTTVSPSARNELLEAARWRSGGILPGLIGEPMRGDDANSGNHAAGWVSG